MPRKRKKKPETAAEVLRRHILAHGNHYSLSRETGVPPQTISRFARGLRRMTLECAQPLLDYFGLELRER